MSENTYIQTFLLITIAILLMVLVIFVGMKTNISEGMVMNKWMSQGYNECTETGECVYSPTKYIIAIQNKDNKDWWYVSQDYYNSVSVGDWIKR